MTTLSTINTNLGRFRTNGSPGLTKGRKASKALAGLQQNERYTVGDTADEMDCDYQIKLARQTIEANIESIPVTFSVENGDVLAEGLLDLIQELWVKTIANMHDALPKGRVAFEKVWEFDVEKQVHYIRKLDDLPYRRTRMLLDDNGAFDGIELRGSKETVKLDPFKSWWLAINDTTLEPHGQSIYMGAPYEVWRRKKEATELHRVFIERFALGWAKAHIDPEKRDPNTGEVIDNFERVMNVYEEARRGGIVCFDNKRDPETKEYLDDIQEMPQIESTEPLDRTIDAIDAQIIRSFGFSEKTVTEGDKVGSFAMVKQQTILLYAVCLKLLGMYADSFQLYVIDPMVDVNYLMNKPSIRLNYPKLTEQADSFIMELVRDLIASPQIPPMIAAGVLDLVQIFETSGIPINDNVQERLAQMAMQQNTTQQQPMPREPMRTLMKEPSLWTEKYSI